MALQKQTASINFSSGLDTKNDPFQLKLGKFLALSNSIFTKGGLLNKRNGFGNLAALPDDTSTYATTFNGDLTAIGTQLRAYSSGAMRWVSKGSIQSVGLSVLPAIRNNTNQSQCDSVTSSNGLTCVTYTDQDPTDLTLALYRYAVIDSTTGQNLISPTTISDADQTYGTPKVYTIGNYFIIIYTNKVVSTYHLKYIAISTATLNVNASVDITTSYAPSLTINFDAATLNNALYIAWNGAAASGLKMSSLTSTLGLSANVTVASTFESTIVSVCADQENQVVWATFFNSSSNLTKVLAVDSHIASVLTTTAVTLNASLQNLASAAQNGVLTIIAENLDSYSYDSSIQSDYLQTKTVTQAGVVGTTVEIKRSVGLASHAFIYNGVIYFLTIYSSAYQGTYFLMDSTGNIVAKLASGNSGPYLTSGLPNVSLIGTNVNIAYLVKDLIQSVNKNTNVPSGTQVNGIYSQTGVNVSTFIFGQKIVSSEIGNNLNLTGGFLWSYDGYLPVEQNFHLWPDVSASGVVVQADPVYTGTTSNVSKVVTAMSSVAGLTVGMNVSGTDIPANTTITAVGTTTITLSNTPTVSHVALALTFTGNMTAQDYFYQVTYEWTDNQGNAFRSAPSIPQTVTTSAGHTSVVLNIPTLRLTYKISNPVKIVVYRWSAAQEIYYQTTSLTVPVLNSTTTDFVTFVDINSDATILGNNIIYTTGGVVENAGPPACDSVTLFDDRLWLIDSEDPNLLWYSKQVIESTPVEMSALFTLFVAPTISAQGATGPMRCLAAMDDKLIIFKKNAIYYINGTGPDNTGSQNQYSQPIFITSTVGSVNQQSIIFTPNGLMFQSDKGIWLLGRDLSTQYIGAPVEAFNSDTVLSAIVVPGTNQVRFTLDSGITLMYDYFFGNWGTFKGIPGISSTLFQDLHTFINSTGQVLQETPGLYLDGHNPVLMSFTTSWINLAGLQGYQRAYYFFLLGTYLSPHKLYVTIATDFNSSPQQSYIISPDNFSGVYGDDPTWGDSATYGGVSEIEQWRNYITNQKCQSFQISISELFDPSKGQVAGAGLTLSGIDIVYGQKKGYPRLPVSRQIG